MDVLDPPDDVANRPRPALAAGIVAAVAIAATAVLLLTQLSGTSSGSPVLPASRTSGPDVVNGTPGHWVAGPDAPGPTSAFITWTGSEVLAGPVGTKGALNPWTVYAYSPTTKQWRTEVGPQGLKPRTPFATVWDGTELLYLGGFIASRPKQPSAFTTTTDSWAFNPSKNDWHRIAALPVSPGQTVNAVWTGKQVLVFSGDSHTYVYDPATNVWITKSAMPGGVRTGAAIAWAGSQLLVWGGLQGTETVRSGWRYDPHTDAWTTMVPAPIAAQNAASAWSGDQFFVWGGESTDATGKAISQPDGFSYDPNGNTWTKLPAAPYQGLVGVTATWTDDAFLIWGREVVAGSTAGPARGAAYDPVSGTWRTLNPSADVAGVGARAFATANTMIVVGGWHVGETVDGSSPHVAQWVPGN